MLAVSRKGKRGKNYSRCRTGKAYAKWQTREDRGYHKHQIQIREYSKSVHGNIDHTNRHTELVGEVSTVARALQKAKVSAKALLVKDESKCKRHGEENDKEHVHKSAISVRKRVIAVIDYR